MPATAHLHHLRVPVARDGVLRRALAVLVAAHGLAHFVGTSDSFSRAADGRSVDWLAGGWELSDPVVLRLFAFAWAVLAVAYAAVALAIWFDEPHWPAALALVSLASLAFVAPAVWASIVGLFVDLALFVVGAVAWRRRAGHQQAGGAS